MADEGLTHTPPGITGCCAAARAFRAGIRVPWGRAQSKAAACVWTVPRDANARVPLQPSQGTDGKWHLDRRTRPLATVQHLVPTAHTRTQLAGGRCSPL